jgi:hypothetical protein
MPPLPFVEGIQYIPPQSLLRKCTLYSISQYWKDYLPVLECTLYLAILESESVLSISPYRKMYSLSHPPGNQN